MKKKTNYKKIMSRFKHEYIWQGVLWLSLILMLVALFLRHYTPATLAAVMIGTLIGGVPCMLLIVLIVTLVRRSVLRKAIMSQGDLNSFNEEDFYELGYSKHFFVSRNWLVWQRGDHYRIFHRSHILGVNPHPEQRQGNRYGVVDFYAEGLKTPLNLYYLKAENVDLPGMLQGWLHGTEQQDNSLLSGTYDTFTAPQPAGDKKICKACMAPNDPSASFCGYCGSPLQ